MKTSLLDLIGYAGAVCNTISFVPQLLRIIRLRSAREISYTMFFTFTVGSGLWFTYGVAVHSAPVAVSNSITLLLSFSIFILKLRYDQSVSPVCSSETPLITREKEPECRCR